MEWYLVRVIDKDARGRTTRVRNVEVLGTSKQDARQAVRKRPLDYGIRGRFAIGMVWRMKREPAGRAA